VGEGDTGAAEKPAARQRPRTDLLLVCSAGGHLIGLVGLRPAWQGYDRVWVTFDKADARALLADEQVVFAHGPTNRQFGLFAAWNTILNFALAWRVVGRLRPRVLLTTGAGVAVPFAWVARLRGARVVFVESLTRIHEPSLSLRLVRPVTHRVYVQWPELEQTLSGSRYVGPEFRVA
jgi:beta-1,4-N-acetylglucosaminyltransferase